MSALSSCTTEGAVDPTTDGCKPTCGRWELNSGPLEEQPGLWTTEPSLQTLFFIFIFFWNRTPPCRPGWLGTLSHSDWSQTRSDPPASASRVLGLVVKHRMGCPVHVRDFPTITTLGWTDTQRDICNILRLGQEPYAWEFFSGWVFIFLWVSPVHLNKIVCFSPVNPP